MKAKASTTKARPSGAGHSHAMSGAGGRQGAARDERSPAVPVHRQKGDEDALPIIQPGFTALWGIRIAGDEMEQALLRAIEQYEGFSCRRLPSGWCVTLSGPHLIHAGNHTALARLAAAMLGDPEHLQAGSPCSEHVLAIEQRIIAKARCDWLTICADGRWELAPSGLTRTESLWLLGLLYELAHQGRGTELYFTTGPGRPIERIILGERAPVGISPEILMQRTQELRSRLAAFDAPLEEIPGRRGLRYLWGVSLYDAEFTRRSILRLFRRSGVADVAAGGSALPVITVPEIRKLESAAHFTALLRGTCAGRLEQLPYLAHRPWGRRWQARTLYARLEAGMDRVAAIQGTQAVFNLDRMSHLISEMWGTRCASQERIVLEEEARATLLIWLWNALRPDDAPVATLSTPNRMLGYWVDEPGLTTPAAIARAEGVAKWLSPEAGQQMLVRSLPVENSDYHWWPSDPAERPPIVRYASSPRPSSASGTTPSRGGGGGRRRRRNREPGRL